jgi:hypothetical protein
MLGDMKGTLRRVKIKFDEEWVEIDPRDCNPIHGSGGDVLVKIGEEWQRIGKERHMYVDLGIALG